MMNDNIIFSTQDNQKFSTLSIKSESTLSSKIPTVLLNLGQLKKTTNIYNYICEAKGKYSKVLRKTFSKNDNSLTTPSDLTFDLKGDNLICPQHQNIKNIFLGEDYSYINPNYKQFSRICINCESDIKEKKEGSVHTALYDLIIRQNKAKIREIREEKVRIGGISDIHVRKCENLYEDFVFSLSEELIGICEDFETGFFSKFQDTGNAEEVEKLKCFVGQMQLDSKGDPILDRIGLNKEREREYISLALFLIYFQGLNQTKFTYTAIVDILKRHILKIVGIRDLIVKKLSEWLRFLLGDFYEYIFSLEKLEIDENFRRNIKITYSNEEEILEIKKFYESEIYFLKNSHETEILNQKNFYENQISLLKTTHEQVHLQQEQHFTLLIQEKDSKIFSMQKEKEQQIIFNQKEKDLLTKSNNDLLLQLEDLKRTIYQMKIEFENTLNTRLNSIKNEYENQIRILNTEIQTSKIHFSEMQEKYTKEIRIMIQERDNLNNQIILSSQETERIIAQLNQINNIRISFESQIADQKKKYEELFLEYNTIREDLNIKISILQKMELQINHYEGNFQNQNGQINIYIQQIESHKKIIETLNHQLEEFKLKFTVFAEKENEISRLKLTITQCKAEWERMSESYESLLSDIRIQLEMNQTLTMVILDVQSKIEKHNLNLGGLDLTIKQQIDILTQQAVTKQKIEVNSNFETVSRCQEEMEDLKNKIYRIESQKLTKSQVFSTTGMLGNLTGNVVDMQIGGVNSSSTQRNFDFMSSSNRINFNSTGNNNVQVDYSKFNYGSLSKSQVIDLGSVQPVGQVNNYVSSTNYASVSNIANEENNSGSYILGGTKYYY